MSVWGVWSTGTGPGLLASCAARGSSHRAWRLLPPKLPTRPEIAAPPGGVAKRLHRRLRGRESTPLPSAFRGSIVLEFLGGSQGLGAGGCRLESSSSTSGCWAHAFRGLGVLPLLALRVLVRPRSSGGEVGSRRCRAGACRRLPVALGCGSSAVKIAMCCALICPANAAMVQALSRNVSALSSHVGSSLLAQWGILPLQEARCAWHEEGVKELRREVSRVVVRPGDDPQCLIAARSGRLVHRSCPRGRSSRRCGTPPAGASFAFSTFMSAILKPAD